MVRWIGLLLLAGCATSAAVAPETQRIAYVQDKDLQRVWVAPGVAFQNYAALFVAETDTIAPRVNPDGVENLAWARGLLRYEILAAVQARKTFRTVAGNPIGLPPGTRALRLTNTIVEYAKGGGGARFFAGLFGPGQPILRVRGRATDGDRLVFAFDARRSGETALARVFGAYRTDKAIQQEDIRDLAQDLADFMSRNGKPR